MRYENQNHTLMKKLALISFLLVVNFSFAQKASDYLCLDTSIVIHKTILGGKDTIQIKLSKTFVFEKDTVCYYIKIRNPKRIDTIWSAYSGKNLTEGNYLITYKFSGSEDNDSHYYVPDKGVSSDTSYMYWQDMTENHVSTKCEIIDEFEIEGFPVFKDCLKTTNFDKEGAAIGFGIYAKGLGEIFSQRIGQKPYSILIKIEKR